MLSRCSWLLPGPASLLLGLVTGAADAGPDKEKGGFTAEPLLEDLEAEGLEAAASMVT